MSTSGNDPPSKRQRLDGNSTTAETPDDDVVCRHDEVKWLISKFSGTRSICVKFGTDHREYFFSEKVLMDNFQYFQPALQRDNDHPVFVEGRTESVHLEEVTTRAFARLFRFLEAQPRVYDDCADLDHILQATIAADYLGLKNPLQHEVKIVERLRLLLLQDRCQLTSAHLELVATHNAFRHTRVWETFAKAGVKPFLQESMLALEYKPEKGRKQYMEFPGRGPHGDEVFPTRWSTILKHCRDLRRGNKGYAADVMEQLSVTLKEARERTRTGYEYCRGGHIPALEYRDPLEMGCVSIAQDTGSNREEFEVGMSWGLETFSL